MGSKVVSNQAAVESWVARFPDYGEMIDNLGEDLTIEVARVIEEEYRRSRPTSCPRKGRRKRDGDVSKLAFMEFRREDEVGGQELSISSNKG